jgi:molybdopterin-guanine dinucleotide biosynthesis protein A
MISSAVILAGGLNLRMEGQKKYFMSLHGKTLLAHMMDVLMPMFSKIVLVSNDSADRFSDYRFSKVVPDLFPGKGPLAGIHAALNASFDEAVFVFACDYPMLDAGLIQMMCTAFTKEMDALVPRHPQGFEPLHAIYGPGCAVAADQLLKERPKVRILEMLNIVNTVYLEMEYNKAFTNFNTPDDFRLWENS